MVTLHRALIVCVLAGGLGCTDLPESAPDRNGRAKALGAALASASAPTTPTVGPEFDLGQPLQEDLAAAELHQAVASNGDGVALVVWSVGGDPWSVGADSPIWAGSVDIYAARVAPDGRILDPEGIPIATTRLGEIAPAVASDGSGWFVTWQGQQFSETSGIFGARVTSDGEVLSSTVISEASQGLAKANRSVAYDGATFLVSWVIGNLGGNSRDIQVARIAVDGTLLDADPILVATVFDAGEASGVDVAFDGTDWLAVWNSNSSTPFSMVEEATANVFGARLSPSGEVIDAFVIADEAGDQLDPALSCQAGNCFVAWNDQGARIVGASVAAGTVQDDVIIAEGSDDEPLSRPAVGWDGTSWLATWLRYAGEYALEAARVSVAGVLLDGTPVTVATGAGSAALTQSSSRALVTWAGPPMPTRYPGYGDTHTYAAFLADGDMTESFVVSRALRDSPGSSPAAAAGGSNWLVVWSDPRLNESSGSLQAAVYATRVGPTGTILDPAGILISSEDAMAASPVVASDGTNWLVVWQEWRSREELYAMRVAPDGTLLDPEPKLVGVGDASVLQLAVAFNGASWLVTWGSDPGGPNRAARVALDGTVLDPDGISIGVPARRPGGAIAGGDGQWLVVHSVSAESGTSAIVGRRMLDDGTLLDGEPFKIAPRLESDPPILGATTVGVAHGGGQWLVAWTSRPYPNNDNSRVYGVRIDASGTVLDPEPFPILSIANAFGVVAPAVAYDGTDWLAAWVDTRVWSFTRLGNTPADIYAARVSTAGQVLDPDGFSVAESVYRLSLGSLAGSQGRWLSVYSKEAGREVGLRARIVENGCVPSASTDTTCDGLDDDCDGTPDDDYSPVATTCGAGACAATGATSCADGDLLDSCMPASSDSDGDGVPDCADACPLVFGTPDDGCPEVGQGGAGGEGGGGGESGEASGGTSGAGIGGDAGSRTGGSGGTAAVAGSATGGTSGTAGHAGESATAGQAGDAGDAGASGFPSAGGGQGGSAAGRGGRAGAAGSTSGHAGGGSGPPPSSGGGCSCSVPAERSATPWSLGLALAGAGVILRRRRRGREGASP